MDAVDPGSLVSYGFGGVLVVLILTKQLVPGWIFRDREKRVEALNAQVERLQNVHEEKVLPALYKANEVLGKLVTEEVRIPGNRGRGG